MLVLPLMLGEWVDFQRPVLALRRRARDPRRGRHGADPAHQRAVRSEEAAAGVPRPAAGRTRPALPPWPTYVDGVTPLPVCPTARRTGTPTTPGTRRQVSQAIAPVAPVAGARRRSGTEQPPSTPPRRARLRGLPAPATAAAATVAPASAPAAPARPSPRCGRRAPLTAPPRRAPEPHSSTRGCSVATPQRCGGGVEPSSSSAHGHDSDPWKMSPPTMPSDSSRSAVVRASTHGVPSGASYTQSAIGSASTESSERVAASSSAARAASRSCSADQPMRNLQSEEGERLGAARPAARARGSTGRSASGSRSRPEADSGCRRPPRPRTPRRAASWSR